MFILDLAAKGKVEVSNFRYMEKWLNDTLASQNLDRVDGYLVSKISMKA